MSDIVPKLVLGLNSYVYNREKREEPVAFGFDDLLSPHICITAESGGGKTHLLKRLIDYAIRCGYSGDIIDPHNELCPEGYDPSIICAAQYSNQTRIGFNPLVLDLDPLVGGPTSAIIQTIDLVKDCSPNFGARQEAVLRSLIQDVYATRGISELDQSSWRKNIISNTNRLSLIANNEFEVLRGAYPCIEDVIDYGKKKIWELQTGLCSKTQAATVAVQKAVAGVKQAERVVSDSNRHDSEIHLNEARAKLTRKKAEAREAFDSLLESFKTGREEQIVRKYGDINTLQSVVDRLENLVLSGVIANNSPRFGNARIRVHQIKSLRLELQPVIARLVANAAYVQIKKKEHHGQALPFNYFLLIDEAKRFLTHASNDPYSLFSNEMRKFGGGLWVASQSLEHIPPDILRSLGVWLLGTTSPTEIPKTIRLAGLPADYKEKHKYLVGGVHFMVRTKLKASRTQQGGSQAANWTEIIVDNQVVRSFAEKDTLKYWGGN